MHGEQTSTIHSAMQRETPNKIRAHILADLGVPYTERDWEVHTRVGEGDYQGLEGRVGELEAWLGKLHHTLPPISACPARPGFSGRPCRGFSPCAASCPQDAAVLYL